MAMDQQEQGGGGSPGDMIAQLDANLSQFGKMMTQMPIPDEIKKAAMDLQGQFRAIVEAAMQSAQGGKGGAQQGSGQPQPMRDQAQGTPMGQYA